MSGDIEFKITQEGAKETAAALDDAAKAAENIGKATEKGADAAREALKATAKEARESGDDIEAQFADLVARTRQMREEAEEMKNRAGQESEAAGSGLGGFDARRAAVMAAALAGVSKLLRDAERNSEEFQRTVGRGAETAGRAWSALTGLIGDGAAAMWEWLRLGEAIERVANWLGVGADRAREMEAAQRRAAEAAREQAEAERALANAIQARMNAAKTEAETRGDARAIADAQIRDEAMAEARNRAAIERARLDRDGATGGDRAAREAQIARQLDADMLDAERRYRQQRLDDLQRDFDAARDPLSPAGNPSIRGADQLGGRLDRLRGLQGSGSAVVDQQAVARQIADTLDEIKRRRDELERAQDALNAEKERQLKDPIDSRERDARARDAARQYGVEGAYEKDRQAKQGAAEKEAERQAAEEARERAAREKDRERRRKEQGGGLLPEEVESTAQRLDVLRESLEARGADVGELRRKIDALADGADEAELGRLVQSIERLATTVSGRRYQPQINAAVQRIEWLEAQIRNERGGN